MGNEGHSEQEGMKENWGERWKSRLFPVSASYCSQQPHSTRRPLGKKAHDGGEKAEWKTHLGNLKLDNPRWEMTTGH